MAVQAAGRHGRGAPRASSGAIRLRDRSAEFRRAKRHSQVVRLLKVLFPLTCVGIISLYAVPALLTVSIDNGNGQASVETISLEAGALKMVNPRVKGVHDKQGEYDVQAASATQQASNPDILHLETINGVMTSSDGQVTTLTAPGAIFNSKIEEMKFERGLDIVRGPGMSAKFQTATVYIPEQRVVSNTPVIVKLHDSTISAQKLTLYTAEARAIFEGAVKVHLQRQPQGKVSNSRRIDPAPAANMEIQSPADSRPDTGPIGKATAERGQRP